MQLGNKIAYVKGKTSCSWCCSIHIDRREEQFVPIRFIAETFGAQVDWDRSTSKGDNYLLTIS
jgi:hypothetical protein